MGREEEIRSVTQTLFDAYVQLVGPRRANSLGIGEFLMLREKAEESVWSNNKIPGKEVALPIQTFEVPKRAVEHLQEDSAVPAISEDTMPQSENQSEKVVYDFMQEANAETKEEKGQMDKESMAIAILNAIDG